MDDLAAQYLGFILKQNDLEATNTNSVERCILGYSTVGNTVGFKRSTVSLCDGKKSAPFSCCEFEFLL